VNGFPLEVVPKRKIAQHFEKRVMVGCHTHVADITRSQTFLTGGGFGKFQRPNPQKLIFELIHAGRCEQHRRVIFGNQNVAGTAHTALAFKKGKIFFTQFVSLHGNSLSYSRTA